MRTRKARLIIDPPRSAEASARRELTFPELYMEFDLNSEVYQPFSQFTVRVYNPLPDTIQSVQRLPGEDRSKVRLYAGYNDNVNALPVVIDGEVFFPSVERTGGDTILIMECTNFVFNRKLVSRSFGEITPLSRVLEILARDAGIRIILKFTPTDINLSVPEGFAVSGYIDDIFRSLARSYGLVYYLRRFDLVEIASETFRDNEQKTPEYILNTDTGLVDYPVRDNWDFWTIRSLFNPIFRVDQFITVTSRQFEQGSIAGRIVSLSHQFGIDEAETKLTFSPSGVRNIVNQVRPTL